MTAYLYRMPSGIPGAVSRPSQSTIEPVTVNPSLPFAGFGLFGKITSGLFVPITTGDAATAIYGMIVRPYPSTSYGGGTFANGAYSYALGSAVPAASGVADCLRRGYITVVNNAGVAAEGGQVYVRVAAPSGAKVIGGIEAAADSTNTIAVPNCTFKGGADGNGNVEIVYNI